MEALQRENIFETQPFNMRDFQFPALPNRRHAIEITAHKTNGKQLKFYPSGDCSILPKREYFFVFLILIKT